MKPWLKRNLQLAAAQFQQLKEIINTATTIKKQNSKSRRKK